MIMIGFILSLSLLAVSKRFTMYYYPDGPVHTRANIKPLEGLQGVLPAPSFGILTIRQLPTEIAKTSAEKTYPKDHRGKGRVPRQKQTYAVQQRNRQVSRASQTFYETIFDIIKKLFGYIFKVSLSRIYYYFKYIINF